MFTVKIVPTYDGANFEVYLDGALVLQGTYLGDSHDQLIEMAKKEMALHESWQSGDYND